MLKKSIFVVLEVFLLLIVYAVGSILPGLNKLPEWTSHASSGRLFVWDGVVFLLSTFVILLAIPAAVRRWKAGWSTPVLALVLSLLLLAATKFPLAWITPSAGM